MGSSTKYSSPFHVTISCGSSHPVMRRDMCDQHTFAVDTGWTAIGSAVVTQAVLGRMLLDRRLLGRPLLPDQLWLGRLLMWRLLTATTNAVKG